MVCRDTKKGYKKELHHHPVQLFTRNLIFKLRINLKGHAEFIRYITKPGAKVSAGIHKEVPGISGKLVMTMLKNPLLDHQGAVDYIVANELNYADFIVKALGDTTYDRTSIGISLIKRRQIPRR